MDLLYGEQNKNVCSACTETLTILFPKNKRKNNTVKTDFNILHSFIIITKNTYAHEVTYKNKFAKSMTVCV